LKQYDLLSVAQKQAMRSPQSYPSLKNPPLKEALLDIRADIGENQHLELLGELSEPLASTFPIRKEQVALEAVFQFQGPEMSSETKPRRLTGFEFQSANSSSLMRLGKTGCSIHQMEGYAGWEKFIPEAKKMWEHYQAIGAPQQITRLGLRYLNQIRLKLPLVLSDYFNFFTQSPANLPFSLSPHMVTQLTLVDEANDLYGIVTLSLIPATEDSNSVDVIFDIDIGKNVGIDQGQLWEHFDDMREMKNTIFFMGVTEKTMEMLNN
jgi:uncharacterized protein (TIGR04255 family)